MHEETAMRAQGLVLGLLLGTVPSIPVAAAPVPAPAVTQPPDPPFFPAGGWYGWQTFIADAVDAVALVAIGTQTSGATTTALAPFTYFVFLAGGPVVHLAHGQPNAAGISAAVRIVFPLLGGLIGSAIPQCQPPPPSPNSFLGNSLDGLDCLGPQLQGFAYGAAVGMGVAAVFDDAVVAWNRPDGRLPRSPPPTPRPPSVDWIPTAMMTYDAQHRAIPTIGVVGSF